MKPDGADPSLFLRVWISEPNPCFCLMLPHVNKQCYEMYMINTLIVLSCLASVTWRWCCDFAVFLWLFLICIWHTNISRSRTSLHVEQQQRHKNNHHFYKWWTMRVKVFERENWMTAPPHSSLLIVTFIWTLLSDCWCCHYTLTL